jgi:hypothetical protein
MNQLSNNQRFDLLLYSYIQLGDIKFAILQQYYYIGLTDKAIGTERIPPHSVSIIRRERVKIQDELSTIMIDNFRQQKGYHPDPAY